MSKKDDYYNSSFNVERYIKPQLGTGQQVQYADGSDAYANINKMVISFYHVPTGRSVYFKAFIEAFNETYTSNWNSEEVYGRPDPIYLFKNTTRNITLAFKIPAATESEAYENLGRVSELAKFLYPSYTDVQGAQTIAQSPLIRIKVMNLLQSTADNTAPRLPGVLESSNQMYQAYNSDTVAEKGLLGVINNVTINHNITEQGVLEKSRGTILPKLVDVNLSFSVIHEHAMGWDPKRRFGPPPGATVSQGSNTFPYGVTLNDPAESAKMSKEEMGAVLSEALGIDKAIADLENSMKEFEKALGEGGVFEQLQEGLGNLEQAAQDEAKAKAAQTAATLNHYSQYSSENVASRYIDPAGTHAARNQPAAAKQYNFTTGEYE